ncbi:hypothetical protein [Saccharibacillus qingshengii]|uniref:hypothetical protein n=1 Tax=Saccharibacillus qingshengii TaxID=1763540 RepID=UPI00155484DF|nr:hypothetical protein [Saccharibacillus qingshengii]
MNPSTFPIILLGNALLVLLVNFVLPVFIVTGPDQRKLVDLPRGKVYTYSLAILASALLIGMVVLRLPSYQLDLIAFALLLVLGTALMLLEKKLLPDTRRHLVTLCWIGGICVLFAIYGGVTYL